MCELLTIKESRMLIVTSYRYEKVKKRFCPLVSQGYGTAAYCFEIEQDVQDG